MYDELEKTFILIPEDMKNTRYSRISQIAAVFANLMVALAISISFISFAYALVMIVMSHGDKMAVAKAKTALAWAVVSMLISGLAFSIKAGIIHLTGLQGEALSNNPEI